MNNDRKNHQQGKTIRVRAETSDRLDNLRHKGQSYDGLITELLDSHESDVMKDQRTQSLNKDKEQE